MTSSTDTYRRELVPALRAANVPPERIGEIVAEVESHVADTGEDPREAFGPARDYAAGFRHPRSRASVAASVATTSVCALCGFLVANGVVGLVDDEPALGMPAWVVLTAGAVLWIPSLTAVLRLSVPVPDPRTGRSITPAPGPVATAVGMSGTLVAVAVVCWGLAVLTS
jgi:HAAS domain-containing protein